MTEKMTMNDMIMLSVDDHAIEPPDLFFGRMPAKYKDETPRVAQYANGDERWVVEGKAWGGVGPAAVWDGCRNRVTHTPGTAIPLIPSRSIRSW